MLSDFGAMIETVVNLMKIELSLWGYTFSYWQILLYGLVVGIVIWIICRVVIR